MNFVPILDKVWSFNLSSMHITKGKNVFEILISLSLRDIFLYKHRVLADHIVS